MRAGACAHEPLRVSFRNVCPVRVSFKTMCANANFLRSFIRGRSCKQELASINLSEYDRVTFRTVCAKVCSRSFI